jgi:hypothetical protein
MASGSNTENLHCPYAGLPKGHDIKEAIDRRGGFSSGQRSFLEFHRKMVLLKAAH